MQYIICVNSSSFELFAGNEYNFNNKDALIFTHIIQNILLQIKEYTLFLEDRTFNSRPTIKLSKIIIRHISLPCVSQGRQVTIQ